MSGSVSARKRITPGAISATSTVSGRVAGSVQFSGTISATSTASGLLQKPQALYIAGKFGVVVVVDPLTGYRLHNIGTVNDGTNNLQITGLAWDPVGSTLYAVTTTTDPHHPKTLLSIDPTTAAATVIGGLGTTNSCTDIACSPTGQLFGYTAGTNGRLVSINKSTGVASNVGGLGPDFSGGLAFNGSTLYYIPASITSPIYTVNTSTGVFTNTGVTHTTYPFAVEGMDFHDGVLYAGGANNYYASIDIGTGVGTFLFSTISDVQAFASVPIPPAPANPSPPANDTFVNAIDLTGQPPAISGTLFGATADWSPDINEPQLGPNVWYKYTPLVNGTLFTSAPNLIIYTGATLGTTVFVGYGGFNDLTGGVTYHLEVQDDPAFLTDFFLDWSFSPYLSGTISATSTVSGAVRHTHQPIVPATGIAATSTVGGAIQFKRITPTTPIAATSALSGRVGKRVLLHPTSIAAISTFTTFLSDIIVYIPPEVFTDPGGPGYPLIGPAAANPDGYFIDSLSHGFDLFQTYRAENLRFKQIIKEVQDADWEISNSQVNSKGDPIVWRRIADNADFILPWQNHFRIRYKESGVETPIMAGFIKSTNSAKGRDYLKVSGLDWLAYLDHRQIPFNPLEPEATYADENFFGPSTPPTGYSYQVAGRDIFRIVHDILEFVLSKPRSLPLDISDPGTTFMGTVINYALALGDTSTALSLINGLSEYWPAFDFMIGYNRNFEVWTPARFGDPDDTATSGPDGDNIAYAFGDDFNHPVMDVEYTNAGVQSTHVLGTGAGTTANRVAKAIGAGDIQRQFWRLDDSVDYGDQAKTQDIVGMRTRREFIFRAREVHEIELTIDPRTVENFHTVIKPGYAIWLRDLPGPSHLIDSAQKIISIEMTVNNQGDRIAVLGLNQIYDTSNEHYGVNEA